MGHDYNAGEQLNTLLKFSNIDGKVLSAKEEAGQIFFTQVESGGRIWRGFKAAFGLSTGLDEIKAMNVAKKIEAFILANPELANARKADIERKLEDIKTAYENKKAGYRDILLVKNTVQAFLTAKSALETILKKGNELTVVENNTSALRIQVERQKVAASLEKPKDFGVKEELNNLLNFDMNRERIVLRATKVNGQVHFEEFRTDNITHQGLEGIETANNIKEFVLINKNVLSKEEKESLKNKIWELNNKFYRPNISMAYGNAIGQALFEAVTLLSSTSFVSRATISKPKQEKTEIDRELFNNISLMESKIINGIHEKKVKIGLFNIAGQKHFKDRKTDQLYKIILKNDHEELDVVVKRFEGLVWSLQHPFELPDGSKKDFAKENMEIFNRLPAEAFKLKEIISKLQDEKGTVGLGELRESIEKTLRYLEGISNKHWKEERGLV